MYLHIHIYLHLALRRYTRFWGGLKAQHEAFATFPARLETGFPSSSSPRKNVGSTHFLANFLQHLFLLYVVFFWDPDLSSKTNKHKQKLVAIED